MVMRPSIPTPPEEPDDPTIVRGPDLPAPTKPRVPRRPVQKNTFAGLLPTLPGGEARDSLASIFPNDQQLANWQPAQTRPRDYTQGGLWNRAYIDTKGELPSQLSDPWKTFNAYGFYRRQDPEVGRQFFDYTFNWPRAADPGRRGFSVRRAIKGALASGLNPAAALIAGGSGYLNRRGGSPGSGYQDFASGNPKQGQPGYLTPSQRAFYEALAATERAEGADPWQFGDPVEGWEYVRGQGRVQWADDNRDLSGVSGVQGAWNEYAHQPWVQPFLDRYAPDPTRSLVTPPVNAPQVVERLGRQQADRVRRAGALHETELAEIAANLRARLAEDYTHPDGWGARRQAAADAYNTRLETIAARLADPIDIESDPSYRLRQTEGRRAAEAALAGAGLGQSGAARQALVRQAGELASQEYAAADARRRANIQAEAGVRQSGFDRLYNSLLRGGEDFAAREREYAGTLGTGAEREYAAALDAINQLGRAQGSALERIVEDQDAEYDRRADEYLRALNNEQRREAVAEARAAAARQRRSQRFSDILGAAATVAGAALGGSPTGGGGRGGGGGGGGISDEDIARIVAQLRAGGTA